MMKIKVDVELYYSNGESIYMGYEGLRLYVKFKIGRFKTHRFYKNLATYEQFIRTEDHLLPKNQLQKKYYDKLENILKDREYIKECATEMVQEYFEENRIEEDFGKRIDLINEKIKKDSKFTIEIEIKS